MRSGGGGGGGGGYEGEGVKRQKLARNVKQQFKLSRATSQEQYSI